MHLNFTGTILAEIYSGKITYWDDPQLEAVNPGAIQYLSHNSIHPIHRSDGSGDSLLFTEFLSKTNPAWNATVGKSTSVNWPTGIGVKGNVGMEQGCQNVNYSIGYASISYLSGAVNGGLGYASIQNEAGNYANISAAPIESDLNGFASQIPANERISVIDGPGSLSYPLVNFEYALVLKNQTNSSLALVIKTFLQWAIDPNQGSSLYYLAPLNLIALPPNLLQLSINQIEEIES